MVLHAALGDWNFAFEDEGRFVLADGRSSRGDTAHSRMWDHMMTQWLEVFQPDATRRETADGCLISTALLDRVYLACPPALVLDRKPVATVVGKLTRAWMPSDHCPVSLAMVVLAGPPPGPPVVPSWVTARPEFSAFLERLCGFRIPAAPGGDPLS